MMAKKFISRREFLERLGMFGGLGAVYYGMTKFGLLPLARANTGPPRLEHRSGEGQHIVILGAGVAGLCAAYLLRNTGFKVTIFESNPSVGGRCLTLRRGDIVQEEGTDRHGNPFEPRICDFDQGADFYFNAGVLRPQFDLSDLLDSEIWKSGLFNDMYLYWQTRSRFWEEENEIYGGISWTKHIISQMWYPTYGFHSRKGVLTGAYNYGKAAKIFGLMSHGERMGKALEGGEKLHPGLFERNVQKGLSILAVTRIAHLAGI